MGFLLDLSGGRCALISRLLSTGVVKKCVQALQEIGSLYFAFVPPKAQSQNPMADMMASLFGGAPGGGSAAPERRLILPGTGGIEEGSGLD